MNSLDRMARRLLRLETEVKHLGRTPQLSNSSVEGGTLDFNDDQGNPGVIIGEQPDGTNASVVVGGPVPPTPAGVSALAFFDGAILAWDGTFVDGAMSPLDFARVEMHGSTDPGFLADVVGAPSSTLMGSFSSPRGGRYALSKLGEGPWYFTFISRSQSGKFSPPSATIGPISPEKISTLGLEDNAVTKDKIAAKAVEERALADQAVTRSKIAQGAVNSEALADFAVAVRNFKSTAHMIY